MTAEELGHFIARIHTATTADDFAAIEAAIAAAGDPPAAHTLYELIAIRQRRLAALRN